MLISGLLFYYITEKQCLYLILMLPSRWKGLYWGDVSLSTPFLTLPHEIWSYFPDASILGKYLSFFSSALPSSSWK